MIEAQSRRTEQPADAVGGINRSEMAMSPNATSLEVRPWTSWNDVASEWARLFDAAPSRSFFVSPAWVDAWLSVFGAQLAPEIVLVRVGSVVAAACLLVTRSVRVGPLAVRRIHLNTSGEDEADEAYVEFNDLLCLEGYEEVVVDELHRHLSSRRWDELSLDGFMHTKASDALLRKFEGLPSQSRTVRSFYVSLDAVRVSGQPFASSLSRNSRRNLKRTTTEYENDGSVSLDVAASESEALEMLDQLAELHQERWQQKDRPGVFDSAKFRGLNRLLIQRLFASGGVQLMRVNAGPSVVGVIFNLVQDRKVYFYLCGFRIGEVTNRRPGLLTVFHAIEHCLRAGFGEFDLMAGDVQYKRTFSDESRELVWTVFQRPSWKMTLLARLRDLKHRLSPAAVATPAASPEDEGASE